VGPGNPAAVEGQHHAAVFVLVARHCGGGGRDGETSDYSATGGLATGGRRGATSLSPLSPHGAGHLQKVSDARQSEPANGRNPRILRSRPLSFAGLGAEGDRQGKGQRAKGKGRECTLFRAGFVEPLPSGSQGHSPLEYSLNHPRQRKRKEEDIGKKGETTEVGPHIKKLPRTLHARAQQISIDVAYM